MSYKVLGVNWLVIIPYFYQVFIFMVEFYHKFYIYIYIYREREREREAYLNHDIDGYQKKIIHIPKLLYYSYIKKKKKINECQGYLVIWKIIELVTYLNNKLS